MYLIFTSAEAWKNFIIILANYLILFLRFNEVENNVAC